jgi:hypothetical protein
MKENGSERKFIRLMLQHTLNHFGDVNKMVINRNTAVTLLLPISYRYMETRKRYGEMLN